jgi:membrane protease YdiL (CAAX protease family)
MLKASHSNQLIARQTNEQDGSPSKPIATRAHFIGFLLIGVAVAAMGFMAQHAPTANGATPEQLAPHGQAVKIYLTAICMDWAMLYYCWIGVHRRGGTLRMLAGERWRSAKALTVDVCVGLASWVVIECASFGVAWLLGSNSAKSVDSLLPKSAVEVLLWAAVCATAAICEELGFRGYVQRQILAFTGSTAVAVVGQGLVFGLFHLYQGWKNVIVISVIGILYGVLAVWRGNLRGNVVSHAMMDFWEGWLKFAVIA